MDRGEFEELETFNLEYDILIDEEDVAQITQRMSLVRDGVLLDDPGNLEALGVILRDPTVRVAVDSGGLGEYDLLGNGVERGWATLLVVKRLRACLQTMRQTPEGTLQRLAEYAIANLPPLCEVAPEDDLQTGEFRKTLALLHLNEICACYKPELSIGFSGQALDRINRLDGPEKNAYELVALLNRGVGYAHLHQHVRSLRDLDEVIEECEKWDGDQRNYLVDPNGAYLSGRLNLKIAEQRSRWQRYVYAHALLHKAEVLSDLSRSTEQFPVLAKLEGIASDYCDKRRVLLEVLARMDGNLWTRTAEGELDLQGIAQVRDWAAQEQDGLRYSLRQKCSQVLLTYRLKYLWQARQPGATFLAADMDPLWNLLVEFEQQSELLGPGETDDAFLLWIDYYELFTSYVAAEDSVGDNDVGKLQAVATRFLDAERFPDREKSRERLLKALKRAAVKQTTLHETEASILRQLLSDPIAPLWQKTKASRRLQSIDQESEDDLLEASLRLPTDEEAAEVVANAKAAFCDVACPTHDAPSNEVCTSKSCRTNTYEQVLKTNSDSFLRQLVYPSVRPASLRGGYCLTVLRRWQSYTPALSTGAVDDSRGGGYFVYCTDKESGHVQQGVVVDPGFDFVENFLGYGFSIHDIHAIVMTHAHVDHTADFLRLVTLIVEHNKKTQGPERKLLALMSPGCFERFEKAIAGSWEHFSDVVVMNTGQAVDGAAPRTDWSEYLLQLSRFRIQARFALHNDTTPHDSVGLVIYGLGEDKAWTPLVGFTGDTMWWSRIGEQYRDVPTLCANLGGIVPYGKKYDGHEVRIPDNLLTSEGAKQVIQEENHLYWPGFSLLTRDLANAAKLVVVSELGEELKGGLRTDMVGQLRGGPSYLPEDIGLTIKLQPEPEVHCCACGRTVAPGDIEYRSYGREESIYYVCKPCSTYRPDAVGQAIADYQDNGWPRDVDLNA